MDWKASAHVKSCLKNRKLTIGSWLTIGDNAVTEIIARAGFDWLTVDMEHSAITLREAQEMVRIIDLCGVVPLVRVGANDPCMIKRVMDAGSHGVIVPMINSKNDAVKAVESAKYPPAGRRGVGLARAQMYGADFEKYKKWVREDSIVVVQIEHIDALEKLEEILSVKGVDASMIGPYDLSASMGHPGEFGNRKVISAVKRYLKICKGLGKPAGFHVVPRDTAEFRNKVEEGYKFLAFCFDALFLSASVSSGLDKIRGYGNGRR